MQPQGLLSLNPFLGCSSLLVAMADVIIESKENLKKLLLKEAKVATELVEHMLKPPPEGLGMESISDFAAYYKQDEFEDGVVTDVLTRVEAYKDDKIQRSRLRSAWRLASNECKSIAAPKTLAGSSEDIDWEAPLDPDVQKAQEEAALNVYKVKFDPIVAPAEGLFA